MCSVLVWIYICIYGFFGKWKYSFRCILEIGYVKINWNKKLEKLVMNYDLYNEVLDYFNVFFNERVNLLIYLEKLMILIEGFCFEKMVMIRVIYEIYM